jgi:uncharacterized membrane protein
VSTEFPEPNPGPDARRLAARLACTAVVSALLLAWQFDLVRDVLPLLWPPTDPVSRWVGLLTVLVGSFLVLPGVVGTLVADWLYDRFASE